MSKQFSTGLSVVIELSLFVESYSVYLFGFVFSDCFLPPQSCKASWWVIPKKIIFYKWYTLSVRLSSIMTEQTSGAPITFILCKHFKRLTAMNIFYMSHNVSYRQDYHSTFETPVLFFFFYLFICAISIIFTGIRGKI